MKIILGRSRENLSHYNTNKKVGKGRDIYVHKGPVDKLFATFIYCYHDSVLHTYV